MTCTWAIHLLDAQLNLTFKRFGESPLISLDLHPQEIQEFDVTINEYYIEFSFN